MNLQELPRVKLAHLPTPLEEMPRLTEALGGPRLLIKRDDETGLASGGNKARKLEFLVADALEKGADALITTGGIQSNHARQTAAAVAKVGLGCHLVLAGSEPELRNGNLLLDDLLGAEVHWLDPTSEATDLETREWWAGWLRDEGKTPYIIPRGGSNPIGACGYVLAMMEAMEQLEEMGIEVDRMFMGSGSAGTHSGILVGAKLTGYQGRVEGVCISRPEEEQLPRVRSLAEATLDFLEEKATIEDSDLAVHDGYTGAGYAQPAALEREAIRLVARQEGIILDTVYTGRVMGGLLDLIERGAIGRDETVLFWHTGGLPAIFVHAAALF
jgi:D-cysteine desulfhydrase family pyridoxal phosphate-dependent enzyme